MNFRTVIPACESDIRINYRSSLFFIGSCFSDEIGSILRRRKFNIMVNPFGVLYNPASVADALSLIIEGKQFGEDNIYRYNDRYLSFSHGTGFTEDDIKIALSKIDMGISSASAILGKAGYLFVTFGTARVYRFKETGKIVSNCHKIPADRFQRELLEVEDIVEMWLGMVEKIRRVNKDIKVIFTVSPVRHWKDGAFGNQVSKSILFLAIRELLEKCPGTTYFPSYELVMDDLRDYRFYKDDMLHPSPAAVEYIWNFFSSTYFDKETDRLSNQIAKIVKAKEHRVTGHNRTELEHFTSKMLEQISKIEKEYDFLDFSDDRRYFKSIV